MPDNHLPRSRLHDVPPRRLQLRVDALQIRLPRGGVLEPLRLDVGEFRQSRAEPFFRVLGRTGLRLRGGERCLELARTRPGMLKILRQGLRVEGGLLGGVLRLRRALFGGLQLLRQPVRERRAARELRFRVVQEAGEPFPFLQDVGVQIPLVGDVGDQLGHPVVELPYPPLRCLRLAARGVELVGKRGHLVLEHGERSGCLLAFGACRHEVLLRLCASRLAPLEGGPGLLRLRLGGSLGDGEGGGVALERAQPGERLVSRRRRLLQLRLRLGPGRGFHCHDAFEAGAILPRPLQRLRSGSEGGLGFCGSLLRLLDLPVPLERLCSHPRFGDDSLQAAVGGRLRRRCRILLQPSGFRYRGGGSPAVEVLRGGGHVVGACHLATRFRLGAGGEYEHLAYLVALADAAVVEVAVGDRGEHVAAVSGCLHDVTSRTGRGTRGTRPYGRLSTHRAPRV